MALKTNEAVATVRGWFSGREDLWAAVEVVLGSANVGWFCVEALKPAIPESVRYLSTPGAGRRYGLGLEDGFEVVEAVLERGYRGLIGLTGNNPAERDEVMEPARRVALLRAIATLQEAAL